jgi:steroid 5-alpha reductase family enzyme
MNFFISAFLLTGVVILVYMTFFYFLSLILKRSDIVDIGWGLGFIFVTISLLLRSDMGNIKLQILTLLVALWGLRLAIHIFLRNKGKEEDFRYQNFKEKWGKGFWWKSYINIFLLQGIFMLLISTPLIYAFTFPTTELIWLDYLGIGVWAFGFLFESIGDYQLAKFIDRKKAGEAKSRFLESGLWSLTRHPNYFGEVVLWWGIWLISIDLGNLNSLITVIGPITISYLIVFVSGVPLLEEKYEGEKEWEELKERVPKFFPVKFK